MAPAGVAGEGARGSTLVVGPGALGCLLAARLAAAGEPVLLLDRDPARAARLAAAGLAVSGPDAGPTRRVAVRAAADAASSGADLVLLCVKVRDTEAAVRALAPLPGATLVVLQNGLDRAQAVAALAGAPERVVGGVTEEGATWLSEGAVRHAGRGVTRLAPLVPAGAARARDAAARLGRAGLDVRVEDDLRAVAWGKLLVNAALNALTGLLGCENGRVLDSPAACALADLAAAEVAAVARASGVPGAWDDAAVYARWRAVARATAHNASSTLQDLRRGRTTEVSAINGALARAARALGLDAPVNELLAQLVAAREEVGLALRGAEAAPPDPPANLP